MSASINRQQKREMERRALHMVKIMAFDDGSVTVTGFPDSLPIAMSLMGKANFVIAGYFCAKAKEQGEGAVKNRILMPGGKQ
jgi:hypothetical protein